MNKIIYLMRHSIPIKDEIDNELNNESIFEKNKKNPLSYEGEKFAEKISKLKEYQNLDLIISSTYTRAISTAKYFAHENNLKINIDERFNERTHGINSWSELPENFEKKQFNDENFKVGYGESQKEVRERFLEGIENILNNTNNKKVLVVTHSTATIFTLLKWCSIKNNKLIYKDKIIYEKARFCETFKLTFNDNEMINIENVTWEENE